MPIQEQRRGTKGRLTLCAVGVVTAVALLLGAQAVQATVYFNYDAETGAVGDPLGTSVRARTAQPNSHPARTLPATSPRSAR